MGLSNNQNDFNLISIIDPLRLFFRVNLFFPFSSGGGGTFNWRNGGVGNSRMIGHRSRTRAENSAGCGRMVSGADCII